MLGALGPVHPVLDGETYLFICVPAPRDNLDAVAMIAEPEGITYVIPERVAQRDGIAGEFPCRRITLELPTALDLVGFMARIAGELAQAGIPCNPVAGYHHDHLFVPADRAQDALAVLEAL